MRHAARTLAALSLSAALLLGSWKPAEAAPPRLPSGDNIAQTALAYRGAPYAWVGDTPATGFSCIGFAVWVYRQWGIWIPENISMLATNYPYVAPSELRPGDLLLFTDTVFAGFSHVEIYIGNGLAVGADNFQSGVRVDNVLDPYWWSHWWGSVRILRS